MRVATEMRASIDRRWPNDPSLLDGVLALPRVISVLGLALVLVGIALPPAAGNSAADYFENRVRPLLAEKVLLLPHADQDGRPRNVFEGNRIARRSVRTGNRAEGAGKKPADSRRALHGRSAENAPDGTALDRGDCSSYKVGRGWCGRGPASVTHALEKE